MPVQPAVSAYQRPVLAGGQQPGAEYPGRLEGDEDDPGDYHGHGDQPAGRGRGDDIAEANSGDSNHHEVKGVSEVLHIRIEWLLHKVEKS